MFPVSPVRLTVGAGGEEATTDVAAVRVGTAVGVRALRSADFFFAFCPSSSQQGVQSA